MRIIIMIVIMVMMITIKIVMIMMIVIKVIKLIIKDFDLVFFSEKNAVGRIFDHY